LWYRGNVVRQVHLLRVGDKFLTRQTYEMIRTGQYRSDWLFKARERRDEGQHQSQRVMTAPPKSRYDSPERRRGQAPSMA